MRQFQSNTYDTIENFVNLEDEWEAELDVIGAAASDDELRELLSRAPNPEAATAMFLAQHLQRAGMSVGVPA